MSDENRIELPKGYMPSDDEPFMNERQQEYFRLKLEAWKDEILRESKSTISALQEDMGALPDLADRASTETDRSLELRARDRQRKLISKIDSAIRRIEEATDRSRCRTRSSDPNGPADRDNPPQARFRQSEARRR